MARSLRDERRLLSGEEFSLVEKTRYPGLRALSDRELLDLRKLVRERRDRAREIAARQRRELRGKSAPRGKTPARDNSGTQAKRDHLAQALQRLNKEVTRREVKAAARDVLMDSARRALELRRARAEKTARIATSRTSNEGIKEKAGSKPRSPRNPARLGWASQYTKDMQAKRDHR
jgi:hypothetical protein